MKMIKSNLTYKMLFIINIANSYQIKERQIAKIALIKFQTKFLKKMNTLNYQIY